MPRPKGSRNKRTQALAEKLETAQCDPALALVEIAQSARAEGNHSLAVDCYKALLPFAYPKLKSTTLNMASGTDDAVVINYRPSYDED